MLATLRTLDPAAIQWHCDRYESAEQFQHLLMHVQDGSLRECDLPDWVEMIAELCIDDGADWGCIPCLADPHRSVWNTLLETYHKEHDDAVPEFFGEGFSIIRR